MKVKVHSSELNRAMKIITQCINKQFSAFSNIEIRHADNLLTFRGTNGTFQATVSTPLLGGDGESFCVDGTMFAKVCSMCSGEVEISADDKVCTVKGAGRTRLPIVQADIPEQKEVEGKASEFAAEDFMKTFGSVSYSISADQSRIQLTGVLCEFGEYGMKMVTLDGFQMSIESAKCDGEVMKIIAPGSFMKLVSQAVSAGEKVTIRSNGIRMEASTDYVKLSCGVLAGDYPDYQRILPKEFKTECLVKVDELKNALKCGSIVNSKQSLVKLDIAKESMRVLSNSEEADYDADVGCETNGDDLCIAFNQQYLMNAINAINTEEAVLKFNTSISPCIIHGKDQNGIHLILPVRTQG